MIDMQQKKLAILSFTHQALDRIRAILNEAPKEALGIRFGVKSGGCSGMAYEVTYAMDEKQKEQFLNYPISKQIIEEYNKVFK